MARPKIEPGAETLRLQILATTTLVSRVDEWRRKQSPIPNRSEAIRTLLTHALDADQPDQKRPQD